jgi:cbb3-type cytochrome oxidase subunit 3
MTILFNLWAIPVVFVIYLITKGLVHFFPASMSENHSGWTIGIAAAVVAGTAETIGVSGRIFFVPVWVWGIGIVCYQLGWMGTAGFVVLLIGGAVWMFKSGKKKEEIAWNQAQEQLAKSQSPADAASESDFWTWAKATLFLPFWMDLSPQICEHNLRVLEIIRKARLALDPEEQKEISTFEKLLIIARALPKAPPNVMKVQTAVEMLIKSKLRKASKTEPLQRAAPLPPLIPAT